MRARAKSSAVAVRPFFEQGFAAERLISINAPPDARQELRSQEKKRATARLRECRLGAGGREPVPAFRHSREQPASRACARGPHHRRRNVRAETQRRRERGASRGKSRRLALRDGITLPLCVLCVSARKREAGPSRSRGSRERGTRMTEAKRESNSAQPRRSQFSSRRPSTRENSRSLSVTSV